MLPTKVKGLSNVKAISSFGEFNIALCANGSVYSWGPNSRGRLGHQSSQEELTKPTLVPNLRNIVAISAGYWHSLALDATGKVYSAGNNKSGELGRDGTTDNFA